MTPLDTRRGHSQTAYKAALALWSQRHRSSVIQLPSAPIEAVRTINIRFSIYIGTY